jgi:histidinol-phosphate aminotransferase
VEAEAQLRLHLNENPYGCSLLVQESLSIHDAFAQHPGPLSRSLLRALSRYAGRPAQDLYLANSPAELLRRVLSCLIEPGDELIAYAPYPTVLGDVAAELRLQVRAARRVDGRVSAPQALRLRTATASAVYVGSPNDPTGDVAAPLEITALLRAGCTVIVDETYGEFTDKGLGLLGGEFPNLISLRSFAPWAGLWGIPVGYAAASAELVERLGARWPQSSLSAPSRIAAGASLDDSALLLNRVRHIRLERARLFRRLRKLNFVQPLPSHGPFIPCRVTRGDAGRVCQLLEAEGILVHNCVEEGFDGHVRISVGTPEQTDQLEAAMCRISVLL